MKNRVPQYLHGYITVEAALIFPIVIIMYVSVIRLGFFIHDTVSANIAYEYMAVRERNMVWSSYNPADMCIDLKEIANKGLMEFNTQYEKQKKRYLDTAVEEYLDTILIGTNKGRQDEYESRYTGMKNSTVVRAIHVLITHAERIVYD